MQKLDLVVKGLQRQDFVNVRVGQFLFSSRFLQTNVRTYFYVLAEKKVLTSWEVYNHVPKATTAASKIHSYEYFLNEVLREDLKIILQRRDELYQKVGAYMEQENVFEKLLTAVPTKPDPARKYKPEPLCTKVDIGCNFYVQGAIPMPLETVLFDIGCGIWLEMTITDALACCKQQKSSLSRRIEALTAQELETKAKINIVLRGLQELQQLSNPRPPEQPEPAFARYD